MRSNARTALAAALAALLSTTAFAQQAPINPANLPSPLPTRGITDTGGISTTGGVNANGPVSITMGSPATGKIFSITNTTAPVSTNNQGYEVYAKDTYAMPSFPGGVRPRIFETNISVPGSTTSTGILENFWSSVYFTGAGTIGAETNIFHGYMENNMTGNVGAGEEVFEASMLNNGTMLNHTSYLALATNAASSTITQSLNGYVSAYYNNNSAAGSIAKYVGYQCNGNSGTGSQPTFQYCLRNDDSNQEIATMGKISIGALGAPGAATQVLIKGVDTANSSFPLQIQSSAGTVFYVTNAGNAILSNGLTMGTSGTNNAIITFNNATSGTIRLQPPVGALNSQVVFLPNPVGSDTLAVLGTAQTFTATQTFSGTLNVSGTLQAAGTAGVSCAAGTVTLATHVVTNGIVTHC